MDLSRRALDPASVAVHAERLRRMLEAAQQPQPVNDPHAGWLLLRIDGAPWAVDVAQVREIVPVAPVVGLRGAPGCVHGLMQLRGTVMAVLAPGARGEHDRIVVIEHAGGLVGVRVQAVERIAPTPPEDATCLDITALTAH